MPRTPPLTRQRGAHEAFCKRGAQCACKLNPLDQEDFTRMHLPKLLWGASLEGITAKVHLDGDGVREGKDAIQKFSSRIKEVYEKGVGLYLFGSKGCGKTGAAAVALKAARSWGFTAYCISVSQLRDAIRAYAPFDNESSIVDRCRTADFLLLDDLRVEDVDEKLFTISDVRNMIVGRYDNAFPTFITSAVNPKTWGEKSPQIRDALEKCCAAAMMEGTDRHRNGPEKKDLFLK